MISRDRLEIEMSVLTSKRVKNRVLLSVVTYEISSPRLCRVLCMIFFLFFPFSFLYLIPFFHFLSRRRAN